MKKAFIAIFSILSSLVIASPVFAITTFVKDSSNPLFISSESPNVLYKDGIYKMWYTTNYGQGWRINYAYSLNGKDGWIIPYQQVISPGTTDGFEKDTANPNVIFNTDLNLYQMWYSSISSNWAGGEDRFRISYATSPDGINWTKNGWALKGSNGMWDSGGPARGGSVLYKEGTYHLWYAATDTGFNWRIGYATSSDGYNFVKQNGGQPVIEPIMPWELNNVEYPFVILNNGIFEMFYASGLYDNTSQIIYATSIDGINWNKPNNSNPVITAGLSYDNLTITSPTVVRYENGTTQMWYGGNVYYILLAKDGPIPTFSPTPTQTLTPSPTPTPIAPKKIIIVPGLAGSWNREALTECKKNPVNNTWSQMLNIYSDLRDRLSADGFTPLIFAYDWRRPIEENGLKLKQFIDSNTTPNEKVFVVGHSMGGLVARSYIEHEQSSNKIEKLLTVGSPHAGANIAYMAVEGNRLVGHDIMSNILFSLEQYICLESKHISPTQFIQEMIPSFYNILPIYSFLKTYKTNQSIPVSSMIIKNNWLPTHFEFPFFGTIVGAMSGTGIDTAETYLTVPASGVQKTLHLWVDGYPQKILTSTAGDGTVLNISSYLPGAQNWSIPSSHIGLINTLEGIQSISEYFTPSVGAYAAMLRTNQKPINTHHPKHTTEALAIVSDTGSFTVKTPKSDKLTDSDGIVVIENPTEGRYEIDVVPVKDNTTIYVGQILSDDNILWKDYTIKKKKKITVRLSYSRSHPKEDPFEGDDR